MTYLKSVSFWIAVAVVMLAFYFLHKFLKGTIGGGSNS